MYEAEQSTNHKNCVDQDKTTENVRVLAAGIAWKLPQSYKPAMKIDKAEEWKAACDKEIGMLKTMQMWKEVALPAGKQVVSSKCVSNRKLDSEYVVTKCKAHCFVQGFNQEHGVGFNKTFAPMARFSSRMILFAIEVKKGWHLQSFDVVSAYPHSPIEKEISVMLPEGYPCLFASNVLRLYRTLYGTKQSTHCWWKFFSKVLSKIGWAYCVNNQSVYVLKHGDDVSVVWIHVEYGRICASSLDIIGYIQKALENSFDLVWQDNVDQIIGIKIHQRNHGIFLSQPTLKGTILEDNGFLTLSAATPMVSSFQLIRTSVEVEPVDQSKYLSLIGILSYLVVGTRPDISFAVNYLAGFSAWPQHDH